MSLSVAAVVEAGRYCCIWGFWKNVQLLNEQYETSSNSEGNN